MSALSSLNRREKEEKSEHTVYDLVCYVNEVIERLKNLNIALGGNYYFAMICGEYVYDGTEINVYCCDCMDSVMNILEDCFISSSRGNSGCTYCKSFVEGSIYFIVSCGSTSINIKLIKANESVVGCVDPDFKLLPPEFLLAEELLILEKKTDSCLSPKAIERFIKTMDNDNVVFETSYVRQYIGVMEEDPDTVYQKVLDNIEKFDLSGDPVKDEVYKRIYSFISTIR